MDKKPFKKLWIIIGILILLSPIGLLLPELFKAGGAWGEWGAEEIEQITGYAPEGLRRLSDTWNSPIPDYSLKGLNEYLSYMLSGIIGVLAVVLISYTLPRIFIKTPKKNSFLDKTLTHITSFMKDTLFNKAISEKRGFLQGIEPRLKLLGSAVLIIAVSLKADLTYLGIISVILLLLAVSSSIPLGMLFKRIMPVFIITSFIALPSMLNLIVEGKAIATVLTFDSPYKIGPVTIPEKIEITETGMTAALTLIMRATASTLIIFLQTMTTPPQRLIKAVSFFLPPIFKSIFSISYRYIFFLIKRLEEFITAYRSRNIKAASKEGRLWVGGRTAHLFSISLRLSQDLEMAIKSRQCSAEWSHKRALSPSNAVLAQKPMFGFIWITLIIITLLYGLL